MNAAFPFSNRGHGAPSLSLLQILSINIHPKTEIICEEEIPVLLSILEGMEMLIFPVNSDHCSCTVDSNNIAIVLEKVMPQ